MATIDYFYTTISPWAYLGHDAFLAIAGAHDVAVRYRPVNLGPVFENSGGLPLGKRHPARQNYRLIELQRWREKRGARLNLKPAYFPVNPGLADCAAIAIQAAGGNPGDYARLAFRAVWADDLDISDETVVAGLATKAGFDGAKIVQKAKSDGILAEYDKNRDDAIRYEIIGSPCYVLNGEPFWGQDRLDLLADALSSGRAAYRP